MQQGYPLPAGASRTDGMLAAVRPCCCCPAALPPGAQTFISCTLCVEWEGQVGNVRRGKGGQGEDKENEWIPFLSIPCLAFPFLSSRRSRLRLLAALNCSHVPATATVALHPSISLHFPFPSSFSRKLLSPQIDAQQIRNARSTMNDARARIRARMHACTLRTMHTIHAYAHNARVFCL